MKETEKSLIDANIKDAIAGALGRAEIKTIQSEHAVAAGEHYLSTLLRVNVTYKQPGEEACEEARLIIKTPPQGILSEFIEESHMFVREMIAYNTLIPAINDVFRLEITPNRIGPIRDDVLVLEDLKLKGFQMKNRVEKLDFDHAKEALTRLADFHAASIVVHQETPELFDEIKKEKIYVDSNFFMYSFVAKNFKIISQEFEGIPHLKKYSERLLHAGEKTWNAVKDAVGIGKADINVFNHGDFWTTNIMYRYDENNRIKESRFVDFQFNRWGSPGFDLQMFYVTSVRDRHRFPELVSIYLERLNQRLSPNTISPERLEKEIRRMDCFGFLTTIVTMAICTLDPKTPLDFGETTTEDYSNEFPDDRPNPYLTALRDERFLKVIPEYLEFYDKMGLF